MTTADRGACARFRAERSRNGKGLSELKSGLQKYIRRGDAPMALWCAGELLSFRLAPERAERKRIATNVRHRFMVIALEDVGEVGLWAAADACVRDLESPDDMTAARAAHRLVSVLSGSPKSRACSHARAVAAAGALLRQRADLAALYPQIAALHAEIEADPSRDGIARWPAALARALAANSPKAVVWAWLHATGGVYGRATGGRLPVWKVFDLLEAETARRAAEGSQAFPPETIVMARRWYKELANLKEAFLCWMLPCWALVRGREPLPPPAYAPPSGDPLPDLGDRKLDDFVYDIHTSAGAASRGRGGLVRFALEGAAVDVESPLVCPSWRAFYEDVKRVEEGAPLVGPPPQGGTLAFRPQRALDSSRPTDKTQAPAPPLTDEELDAILDAFAEETKAHAPPVRPPAAAAPAIGEVLAQLAQTCERRASRGGAFFETAVLQFIVRTQINTSRGKTDVYLAAPITELELDVVVKGPFASGRPTELALAMNAWKRVNGLPAPRMVALRLLPDRWPKGTPLGLRNGCDRSRPAWFLLAESLLPPDPPLVLHPATKLWPATEVVDWARLPGLRWEPTKDRWDDRQFLDYVLALFARYVAGIGDLADRNFIRRVVDGAVQVVSLDEDARSSHEVHMYAELRKKKAGLVHDWLGRRWGDVAPRVRAWTGVRELAGDAGLARWRLVSELSSAQALFKPPE